MAIREIRVFLASPGDVEAERQIFYEILPQLGPSLGVMFTPTGYELAPAGIGQRAQDVINAAVDGCDIFVAIFHRHWGQEAPDAIGATSYTEEEFNRALRRHGRTGSPAIFCFFKNLELHSLADPGPQLTKVLEFRRRLEESRQVLYRTFGSEADFSRELEWHLNAYVSSSLQDPATPPRRVLLPIPADAEPDLHRNRDLSFVEQAISAASAGRLEEAERLFARLSQTTVTVSALDIAKTFYEAVKNDEAVQAVLDRKLALLRDRRLAAQEYMAALMGHGWMDTMIAARLSVTPPDHRASTERILRLMFGPRFNEALLDMLIQNFTLGELRNLTRFYTGDGVTVSKKMAEFMGRVIPPFIERLEAEVLHEIEGDRSSTD